MSTKQDKTICPGCGGSGQVSFFKGESRFLLTMEECLECNGTGILMQPGTNRKKKKQIKKSHDTGK